MGRNKDDSSSALLRVSAADEAASSIILRDLQRRGVELVDQHDAALQRLRGRVFPENFYSTTNLRLSFGRSAVGYR